MFPGDVARADPRTTLSSTVVGDASQVWEFLETPASLPGDSPTVSVCFYITLF